MVISEQHSKEIYLIQRRIKFLQEFDQLINDDADPEEARHLSNQFAEVKDPADLIQRLKEIYGDDLE